MVSSVQTFSFVEFASTPAVIGVLMTPGLIELTRIDGPVSGRPHSEAKLRVSWCTPAFDAAYAALGVPYLWSENVSLPMVLERTYFVDNITAHTRNEHKARRNVMFLHKLGSCLRDDKRAHKIDIDDLSGIIDGKVNGCTNPADACTVDETA